MLPCILAHPDKVKGIVLACVGLHNMLRAERGTGGREMMRRMGTYPVT